jgi:hypothetical protein
VIWVPNGDNDDATRRPAEFDAIAAFLQECGAEPLELAEDTRDKDEPLPVLL